jgi:hypothetical protein
VNAHHVRLRAERAGTGSGRFYTITITCTDSAGNSTSKDVAVFVAHNFTSPVNAAAFKIGPAVNFTGTFWDLRLRPEAVKWAFARATVAGVEARLLVRVQERGDGEELEVFGGRKKQVPGTRD